MKTVTSAALVTLFFIAHMASAHQTKCEAGLNGLPAKKLIVEPTGLSFIEFEKKFPSLAALRGLYASVKGKQPLKPVVILDTGLAGEMVRAAGLNVVASYDLTQSDNPVTPEPAEDEISHGTGIATLLGGNSATNGYAGVLPGHPVITIRIGSGDEFLSHGSDVPFERFAKALEISAKAGARVVNMGWTMGAKVWDRKKTQELIWQYSKQLLIVNASGNQRLILNRENPSGPLPATLFAPNLITVGATDGSGAIFSDSNRGSAVDIFALGTGIPEWRLVEDSTVRKLWRVEKVNGTSHSAPLIAALAVILDLNEPGVDIGGLKFRVLELANEDRRINFRGISLDRR